jgi:ABC-type branched-subunit amino acid transport system ATPase component
MLILVMRTCEGVIVLDFGEVIAAGSPQLVRSNQAVVGAYLGDPGLAVAMSVASRNADR